MVKITKKYIINHCENLKILPKRLKSDCDNEYLKKITHLKLQGRYIESFDPLPECVNTTSLYLQNNLLHSIANIESLTKLSHLYLQRNKITKMEGLNLLPNLKKVYLGYNEITVIEGMENLKHIKEFHIEHQSLPLGETIYFEPRTVENLAVRIEVLNISGNNLATLTSLSNMYNLIELQAADNKLSSLQEFGSVMQTWPNLIKIDLRGNAIASLRELSTVAILNGPALRYIDGTEVTYTERKFIEGWKKARGNRRNQPTNKQNKLSALKAVHFPELKYNFPIIKSDSQFYFHEWKLRKNVNCSTQLKSLNLRKSV